MVLRVTDSLIKPTIGAMLLILLVNSMVAFVLAKYDFPDIDAAIGSTTPSSR